jgi:hypothetical protein
MTRRRPGSCPLAALAVLVALAAGSRTARADGMPMQREALLLLKVLSYDENLRRSSGPLRVAVIHQAGSAEAERAAQAVVAAFQSLRKVTVQGRTVEAVLMPAADEAKLRKQLLAAKINTVYFGPGVTDAAPALRVCRALSLNALTGNKSLVQRGVPVGVFVEGDRPQILVNLEAARVCGHRFSSALFKVAQLLRSTP